MIQSRVERYVATPFHFEMGVLETAIQRTLQMDLIISCHLTTLDFSILNDLARDEADQPPTLSRCAHLALSA